MENPKKIVETPNAPKAIGPYSQAVISGGFLFGSGQIPLNPETMKLVSDELEDQVQQVLLNIQAVLESEGLTFNHIVKTTIYLLDIQDFQKVNSIYSNYFSESQPARSTIQVAGLPLNAKIEIDFIAKIS